MKPIHKKLLLFNQGSATPWYLAGGILTSQIYAAYQPKRAASYAASLQNLINPGTHDLTEGVAPTWATGTGWTFNGTTQYLITDLTPDTTGRYSAFISCSSITRNATVQMYFGYFINTSRGFNVRNSSATILAYQYGTVQNYASVVTSGVFGLYGDDGYYNGSQVTTGTFGDNLLTTGQPLYLGCANEAGSPNYFSSAVVTSFIIFNKGVTLTAAQITSLSTAMANL